MTVHVEFLCETGEVDDGAIFRPKDGAGSKMAAFNVRGAMLSRDDFVEVDLEAERLDGGGWSRVTLRVANLLPYVALKTFAFQESPPENCLGALVLFSLARRHSTDVKIGWRHSRATSR